MLTPDQRREFARALAQSCSIRIFDGTDQFGDDIRPTSDDLTDFSARWGPPCEILTAENGVTIHVWRVPRTQDGGPSRNFYVADFGGQRATVQFFR